MRDSTQCNLQWINKQTFSLSQASSSPIEHQDLKIHIKFSLFPCLLRQTRDSSDNFNTHYLQHDFNYKTQRLLCSFSLRLEEEQRDEMCSVCEVAGKIPSWVLGGAEKRRDATERKKSAVARSKWAANSRLNDAHPCYFVRSQWFLFNIRDICSFVLTLSVFCYTGGGAAHNGMGVSAPKKESEKKASRWQARTLNLIAASLSLRRLFSLFPSAAHRLFQMSKKESKSFHYRSWRR